MANLNDADFTVSSGLFAVGTTVEVAPPGGDPVRRTIESLHVGNSIRLWSGGTTPIEAITAHRVDIAAQSSPGRGAPILLRAGALAPGIPTADMLLPQEALLAFAIESGPSNAPQPCLVPIGALVNTRTITRHQPTGLITWYSIRLPSHDVILVEGAPAATLRGLAEPPCLDMLPVGPALMALRTSLARRASRPEFADPSPGPPQSTWIEPDRSRPLRLFIEDQEIPAEPSGTGRRFNFLLPANTGPVRLHSPAHASPAPKDTRRLGVCVVALTLDDTPLALDGPAAGPGFHPLEGEEPSRWRWTNGDAWLVLPYSTTPRRLQAVITDWHESLK